MEKPWTQGSKELLNHAAEHLENKSDFDRRIAFISIDNAVEIIIKSYLSAPKRGKASKKRPSRKELKETENSFPGLLDLLEQYDSDKLTGISLEDIEWYHRLRNELYHSGNGITVELSKVETYFEIASTLFESLFEEKLVLSKQIVYATHVGLFLEKWTQFEHKFRSKLPEREREDTAYDWKRGYLDKKGTSARIAYDEVSFFRNNLVHGLFKPSETEITEMLKKIDYLDSVI
ncbi:hypothetical protein ACO2J1_07355 [Leptospira interrogans]|uniref:Uncharacterized protein n=1 Tax=Leptospira interrogans serovar Canicola TaxID=211880 RepID=A0A067YC43_LEPIR|nr:MULTISPECIES: hypothetical protein [Leptospira]AGZ84976.1 hypothetical protein [Leptospira interrogans serovar Canicola]EKO70226.1 hypothetical protein LEP1GSC069_1519 [Leptospira interrogans serovar Canicola str. Fiocruz LV133]EMK23220.1 hypothetical protein LEP1GSC075_1258 [Leptospira interrogans str. Kito]EMN77839.1 hypothetical protein LEP1GSC102_1358 [Leptospira interrogans str. UI 09600]MCR8629325.1 hypothetical protein [Leptospira interrogans serovar Canicola]